MLPAACETEALKLLAVHGEVRSEGGRERCWRLTFPKEMWDIAIASPARMQGGFAL